MVFANKKGHYNEYVLKGGHFGKKTRWRPLEYIFRVALTLNSFVLLSTSRVPSSCFYHKMHDSSQNCYISAPLSVVYSLEITKSYYTCTQIDCDGY